VIKKPQKRRPRPDLGCRAIEWNGMEWIPRGWSSEYNNLYTLRNATNYKIFLAVSASNIRHGGLSLSLQSVIAIAKCP
jgi:hypothetical protein